MKRIASTFLLVVSSACSSFGVSDPVREDAGAADDDGGPSKGPSDGGAPDAPTSSCTGGRDAGFTCGTALCMPGQACCLAAVPEPVCQGTCPSTQRNCTSKADCGGTKACCQVGPASPRASVCRDDCEYATLCEHDDECGKGEFCGPPTGGPLDAWHCQKCP